MHMDTTEFTIAQWQESEAASLPITKQSNHKLMLAGAVVAIVFLFLAIWLRNISFGVATFVSVFAIYSLRRIATYSENARRITLTNQRLQIGEQSFAIDDIAGFWLRQEGEILLVTFEPKKASLIPISCAFANTDEEVARQMLSQALAELEARPRHFTDSWIKFLS